MMGVVATTGAASAATPNAPIGATPRFYSTAGVQQIRAAGSETTFYMMSALGDLYNQSSLFGCVLSSSDNRTCTQANNSATDELDDWSRNEFTNGAGVGSGGGIGMLCGSKPTGGLSVDFARSSRALGSSDYAGTCNTTNLQTLNYADDSVVPLDFPQDGTVTIGSTPVCTTSTIAADLPLGTCQIGPVAAGWSITGNGSGTPDPLAGPYTGTPFNNMTVFGGSSSLANRIYCSATNPSPITDWGQLTGSSSGLGSGTTAGIPFYIPFVNTASGTYSTYKGLVGCDTNSLNKDGQLTQENDAPQLGDEALAAASLATRWPNCTGSCSTLTGTAANVNAENQLAASLYYISFGVALSHKYTAQTSLPTGCKGSACVVPSFPGNQMTVDSVVASQKCAFPDPGICTTTTGGAPSDGTNDITTARQLYNVVKTDTIRGSVAGLMNYICDANNASEYGTDLTNGKNYASEVVSTVVNNFGFPYQNCAQDSGGNDIPAFIASGTPAAGQYVVPAANIGS